MTEKARGPGGAIGESIRAERVAVLFRQTPIMLAVNAVNAALTAFVLAPVVPAAHLLAWLVVFAAVIAIRFVAWRRFVVDGTAATPRWAAAATILAAATGAMWGVGGALLLPEAVPQRVFLTLVAGGMCAGAAVLVSAHLPAFIAFLVPGSLPLGLRFLVDGETLDTVLGGMILLFALALAAAGWNLSRSFGEALRLRFELSARTAELDAANERLRAEVAEHGSTAAVLRQAQKMEAVGQLTGGIAHDFNNLLTAVIGNIELAIGRCHAESRAALPVLQGALKAAERGAALTQRLLAFARRQRLKPRSVDLAALLTGLADLLRQTLGPSIRLEIAAAPDATPAQVDANQLELAILNLAINGRDAMPDGGLLRIALGDREVADAAAELAPGDYVVITVEDSGAGMDEAVLARAFEPFFTTKDIGKGSGLGLPMVQGFAQQSGGTVRLASRRGHGTSVEIWLPRATSAPDGDAARRAGEGPGLVGARILLCDDDDDVRQFVATFLRDMGCRVAEVSGGEAVLQLIDQGSAVDLLVVDYAMAGMNGVAVIDEARRRRPGLKVLLITGHAEAPRHGTAEIPLLAKPFHPAELAECIRRILAADPIAS
jgi:signal transduction histidine kinase